jgi:FdhE protein
MQRTDAGEAAARLDSLERAHPEWRPWVELLRVTFHAAADPASDILLPEDGPRVSAPGDPLLHGREVRVDADRLGRRLERLGELVGLGRVGEADVLELARAAVGQDGGAIERLAQVSATDPGVLETIVNLAVWPLLQACGRGLQAQIPPGWTHGYCPVCGAWPVLAELRGLERARCLRCGRCGADWQRPWLACVYCDERDHERLGSLVVSGRLEGRTVETCANCHGHLKSHTTLLALAPPELLVADLETVELDLAARERGFRRPSHPGYGVDLRLTRAAA